MKVSVISNIEEIRESWLTLFNALEEKNPFMHPSWYSALLKHYYSDIDPRFYVVSKSDEIIAVLPMYIQSRRFLLGEVKVLQHLSSNLADYSGVIISSSVNENDIIKKICRFINEHEIFDVGILDNLNQGDINSQRLKAFFTSDIFKITRISSKSLTPKLSVDNFDKYISKRIKQDTKRCKKRISEIGNLDFNETNSVVESKLDRLLELKNENYPGSDYSLSSNVDFLKCLCCDADFKPYISYSELKLNGNMVSSHIGFKTDTCFYYYMPVFDSNYRKYAVGNQLLIELLNVCRSRGISKFDFLRGDESYKFSWAEYFSWNEKVTFTNKSKFKIKLIISAISFRESLSCIF